MDSCHVVNAIIKNNCFNNENGFRMTTPLVVSFDLLRTKQIRELYLTKIYKLLNFLPEQSVIFQRLAFILWPWIDKMLGKRGNRRKTIKK